MIEEMKIEPGLDEIAFMDLKSKIVKCMWNFSEKYDGKNSPIYPYATKIIVDVLTACLDEAQRQNRNRITFTTLQIDHICYQIGNWYLLMKNLLEGEHNLGYMKEKLKTMICGE